MKQTLRFLGLLLLLGTNPSFAQKLSTLTVEKIMRDPKTWIGTSPSNVYWSEDSQTIYFSWNPDKAPSDSLYRYSLADKKIAKVPQLERKQLPAAQGTYNRMRTLKVYAKDGDIYLLDRKNMAVRQLTNTVESESNPSFSGDEQSVFFERGDNLFSVSLTTGLLTQHTDFKSGKKKEDPKLSEEEQWLKDDQLAQFQVLKERKEKKDAGKKISEAEKTRRPKEIYLGEKEVDNPRLSPDGRFVTYRLAEPDKKAKRTIVPNYVTESGFTEDLPARTKVGAPMTSYEFWVYDIQKDTARKVPVKQIAGISDKPDYLKDYPKQDSAWKKDRERAVLVHGPFWSEDGRRAVVVVRSLDNKDRWIMAFNPDSLSLRLLDRQRDDAWIGGPGMGNYPMNAGQKSDCWCHWLQWFFVRYLVGYYAGAGRGERDKVCYYGRGKVTGGPA